MSMEFDKRQGALLPVEFQSDGTVLNWNMVALSLCDLNLNDLYYYIQTGHYIPQFPL